ncbi:MAG: hypothetical protein IH591_05685 [Bacteroidales bacterium]|nr:hypothetical protein [Bacteroidales bacterium]
MAVLFRIFLIGLLVYLVLRTISSFGARTGHADTREGGNRTNPQGKKRGVSKDVGEYVDYEEVNGDD